MVCQNIIEFSKFKLLASAFLLSQSHGQTYATWFLKEYSFDPEVINVLLISSQTQLDACTLN